MTNLNQWNSCSFMIELKPNSEYASLFVNCPRNDSSSSTDITSHVLRISEQSIMLTDGDEKTDDGSGKKEVVTFGDILLYPNSICSVSWADQDRKTFMCKIRAQVDGLPFAHKSFKRLEDELNSRLRLSDYINLIDKDSFLVRCSHCKELIHSSSKAEMEFGLLPNDDWLETSPSMEYTCKMSGSQCCGGSSEQQHQGLLGFNPYVDKTVNHWLPTDKKIVLSDSYLLIRKHDSYKDRLNISAKEVISCSKCSSELGILLRHYKDVYRLSVPSLLLSGDDCHNQNLYIENRFNSLEKYFAWLLLYKCEQHSSSKLLIRSFDKTPLILLWLLESQVRLTFGKLTQPMDENCDQQMNEMKITQGKKFNKNLCSFSALKILYKIFDENQNDPKTSGNDTSIGIIEMPLTAYYQLAELLLSSSFVFPPPLRALGQFYVGFMRVAN